MSLRSRRNPHTQIGGGRREQSSAAAGEAAPPTDELAEDGGAPFGLRRRTSHVARDKRQRPPLVVAIGGFGAASHHQNFGNFFCTGHT